MGAKLAKRDPRIEAKLLKLADKRSPITTVTIKRAQEANPKAPSSDKEILVWLSAQAAKLSDKDSLLLNKGAVANDGSLLFVPCLLPELSVQMSG